MELSASEQERHSRHLLLDGFDQDKVKDAFVAVRGKGAAAHWAARYLAASGVGRLHVEEPAWRDELLGLGPGLAFCDPGSAGFVCAPIGEGPTQGALAAVETLRQIAGPRSASIPGQGP